MVYLGIFCADTGVDMAPRCARPFWLDNDPSLCPPFSLGYSPSLKKWARFYVDRIEPAGWNEKALDALVLPDARKKMVRSLVGSHQFQRNNARDQSGSKGKGLVVLLHGAPGTGMFSEKHKCAEVGNLRTSGKTLTAESG